MPFGILRDYESEVSSAIDKISSTDVVKRQTIRVKTLLTIWMAGTETPRYNEECLKLD